MIRIKQKFKVNIELKNGKTKCFETDYVSVDWEDDNDDEIEGDSGSGFFVIYKK